MTQTETLDDIADLVGVFEDVARSFDDITYEPILVALSPKLQELHKTYFESQTDPAGAKWKPLAPSTIARKGHDRILWETSALEQSLVTVTGDSVRDVIAEGFQEWLIWGTSVEYAMYHQEPGPTSRLPQRKHVGVTAEFIEELQLEVTEHTIKELRKNDN